MLVFPIIIEYHRKRYHLHVEQQESSSLAFEVFKVYPTANPEKFIILQSNRPVLLRHHLKHKAIDWKVIKGQPLNRGAFECTIEAIEQHLRKR